MNTIGLVNNIKSSHRAWNGATTEELCKIAHNRMWKMRHNKDARSIRDFDWLDRATTEVGYPINPNNH